MEVVNSDVDNFSHSYGDRAPVTILGRLFGIFWTLAGLVVLSVVIGAISTSLATVSLDVSVPLYGTKVRLVSLVLENHNTLANI